jgi:hypothetical protein
MNFEKHLFKSALGIGVMVIREPLLASLLLKLFSRVFLYKFKLLIDEIGELRVN